MTDHDLRLTHPGLRVAVHPSGEPLSSPGTLRMAGPAAELHVFAYGLESYEEMPIEDLSRLDELKSQYPVIWLNVTGIGDGETLQKVGDYFGIHRLELEDIQNVGHRPRMEDYDSHLFFVARMVRPGKVVEVEQLAMALGSGFVVTFQTTPVDSFEAVRKRIRKGSGNVRRLGADYLAFALLDSIVDGYFPVLEEIGDRLEDLELAVSREPTPEALNELQVMKHEIRRLRRSMGPQREYLNELSPQEYEFISDESEIYWRSCADHASRIVELTETYQAWASDIMDFFDSKINGRMNEIMKALTLIATIFIPLTFIAGIYGMNFDPASSSLNMPELSWRYGYPATLLLMTAVGIGLFTFFRRKGWF